MAKEVKKVTVIVPSQFGIRLPGASHAVIIQPGIQELDEELANHWYSKANGVQVYKAKEPVKDPEETEEEKAAREADEKAAAEKADAEAKARAEAEAAAAKKGNKK